MKRGDPVTLRGTIWQEARCETVIVELDGGGLIAVPAGAIPEDTGRDDR